MASSFKALVTIASIILCSSFVSSAPQEERELGKYEINDGQDEPSDQPNQPPPTLLSRSSNITKYEGESLTLPCIVNGIGKSGYGTLWRFKANTLLFASATRITHDQRINVKSGDDNNSDWSLTINNVTSSDTGEYSCTLSTPDAPTAQYFVTVKPAPPPPRHITKGPGAHSHNDAAIGAGVTVNNCQIVKSLSLVMVSLFLYSRTTL